MNEECHCGNCVDRYTSGLDAPCVLCLDLDDPVGYWQDKEWPQIDIGVDA